MRISIPFFCFIMLLTGCMNPQQENTQLTKNTYLLVHGAWHGKWCWQNLTPRLEKEGHTVLTIDLPGSGSDKTAMSDVNLAAYTDAICDVLSDHENVILLGHSLGGVSITQAGEVCTEKIKSLVYLTAVLPENGESLMSRSQSTPPPEANEEFIPHYEISADGLYSTIKADMVKEKLCNDCSDEVVSLIQKKLSAQSNIPLGDPVAISEERYGQIPRYYIETTEDNIIPIENQRAMYEAVKCNDVFSLEASHSPFFSVPDELAAILLQL